MTISRKKTNTGWFTGGGIVALLMILLAESSTPPRDEAETSATINTNTIQKDFRNILQNIKTIPGHLVEETGYQTLLVKRLSGVPEPANGPMAILSQMEAVRTPYLENFDMSAVKVPAAWDTNWLLEIIRQDPSVKYAYKEPKMQSIAVRPNDEVFGSQTNLHDPVRDVDIDAPEAWAYTTGSDSVVVAILDTNLDTDNPDLRPNLWVNSSETAGNGIDDDNNGCTDDIHGCNLNTGDGNIEGDDAHGTIVASILARGNNNYAITGIIWNTRIMFLRGGVVEGVQHVMRMRRRGVNVRAINHSRASFDGCNPVAMELGTDNDACDDESRRGFYFDCDIRDAIRDAGQQGIMFVQGIGNNNIDYDSPEQAERQLSPGCIKTDNMIVVAGQSETSRTRWVNTNLENLGSNYGANIGDLYAPAENLHHFDPFEPFGYLDGGGDGTSLATPHVAAAAALLWSFRPDLTVTEVRSALLDTVDRFDSFKLRDENGVPTTDTVASGGALNIANALYSVATPGIRIHSSQTTIAEGTSGYIDLSLTREPVRPSVGEVVVLEGHAAIMPSSAAAVVTPSTLTFTSANWHIPQRMTVRAAGASGSEVMLQIAVNDERSTTDYRTMVRTATMTLQSDGIRPTLHMPSRIAEGDITTATIRFSDPLISTAQFTITAASTSTAAEGEDYTLPNPITATPGATSAAFAIRTTEHPGYNGPDKTIHLQVTTDNPHILREALPLPATLTIEDKDTPIMTITVFPRTITQSNTEATAPTATATIQLDRPAVADVPFSLDIRSGYRHDISHLRNHLTGSVWPVSATITENATSTEIIIHSIDEDDEPEIYHRITLPLNLPADAAARLGTPRRARLNVWDDDGNLGLYLSLRVFLEGAVETTPTTIRTNP